MIKTLIATSLLAGFSLSAHADGLSDLKTALARLQGQTPLKAVIDLKTWSRQGEGKEQEERNGAAAITIDDGSRGLQLLYSKDVMARMESEELAREKNPKAPTPTLSAIGELGSSDVRSMIYAARSLTRAMEKAVFKAEKLDSFGGKPARLLSFDIPLESIPEKDRKYIKKFEGTLSVWIAADGTPLSARTHRNIGARAFMVVSFENSSEDAVTYSLVGDRLVTVRKETKTSGAGMGEKSETRVVKQLQLQS